MDSDEIIGYASYKALQRLELWESRRVCRLDEIEPEPDYSTAKRIAEAVLWIVVFFLITFFGLLLLSSDFVATGKF